MYLDMLLLNMVSYKKVQFPMICWSSRAAAEFLTKHAKEFEEIAK